MSDELEPRRRILVEYAKWTARSAVASGSPIKGRETVYRLLDGVTFQEVLNQSLGPISCRGFNEWHRCQTEELCARARQDLPRKWIGAHGPEFPVGWGTKLINVFLKTAAYVGDLGRGGLRDVLHPPLDAGLQRGLRAALLGARGHRSERDVRCDHGHHRLRDVPNRDQWLQGRSQRAWVLAVRSRATLAPVSSRLVARRPLSLLALGRNRRLPESGSRPRTGGGLQVPPHGAAGRRPRRCGCRARTGSASAAPGGGTARGRRRGRSASVATDGTDAGVHRGSGWRPPLAMQIVGRQPGSGPSDGAEAPVAVGGEARGGRVWGRPARRPTQPGIISASVSGCAPAVEGNMPGTP